MYWIQSFEDIQFITYVPKQHEFRTNEIPIKVNTDIVPVKTPIHVKIVVIETLKLFENITRGHVCLRWELCKTSGICGNVWPSLTKFPATWGPAGSP